MEVFDLKRFRKERNIQQKNLAETLGVSQSFLSYIEHGKRPMPADMMDKLCELYEVANIDDYISTVDNPTTNVGNGNNNYNVVNSPLGSINASQAKHMDSLFGIIASYEKRLSEADKKIERLEKELEKYRGKSE